MKGVKTSVEKLGSAPASSSPSTAHTLAHLSARGSFGWHVRACVRAACASVRLCVRRACACAPTSDIAIGRNGGHELLRLRADFVARHAHAHWLVVAVLEEHDPVLLLAALAADDTPAVPAVVPPLQHIKVFAAGRARLGALVGLPFWPPVALRGLRHGALQRGGGHVTACQGRAAAACRQTQAAADRTPQCAAAARSCSGHAPRLRPRLAAPPPNAPARSRAGRLVAHARGCVRGSRRAARAGLAGNADLADRRWPARKHLKSPAAAGTPPVTPAPTPRLGCVSASNPHFCFFFL